MKTVLTEQEQWEKDQAAKSKSYNLQPSKNK